MRKTILVGILFLSPILPCRGQQVGDSVVVIVPTANIQIGEKVVAKAYRGAILVVRKVQGDWLAVSHGTPGWLHKDDVMLLGPAVDYFSGIIRDDPQDAGAWFVRGNIRSEQGEFTKAIADFSKTIALDPKEEAAYNSRGYAWRNLGEPDKAIADFNQALQINAKDIWALNNRGIAWTDKADYDKAIADFDQVLRLDSKHTWAYHNRGNAWAAKKDYKRAVADYDQAIGLDPKDGDLYGSRGIAQQALGKYDLAVKDFSEAADLGPNRSIIHHHLAWLLAACPDAKLRDGKKAVASAKKACDLTGWKDAVLLDSYAAAQAEAGDFDAAVRWEARAIELAPKENQKEYRQRLELYRMSKPYRFKTAASGK
jgi:tetratricopeptide (TPR) repeat protein